jgi:chemotaxis protein CheX
MTLQLVDDDLADLAGAIWTSIVGESAEPGASGSGGPAGERAVTACVHISGGWHGSVSVVLPSTLAEWVASRMFDVPGDELTAAEICDAVGELANIAGGNVKGLIEESCELSLPVVAEGEHYVLAMPGSKVTASATLVHDGIPFSLELHERA